VLQLWAVQLAQYAAEGLVHQVEYVQRDVWLSICSKLVGKASGIVALKQFCTVEDASSEVGDVNTGESVSLAEVTTDVEEFGLYADVSYGLKRSKARRLLRHVVYIREEVRHSRDPP
jgi:hypothetical protein